MARTTICSLLLSATLLALLALPGPGGLKAMPPATGEAQGNTYYVSNAGDDDDDGLSPETTFATVAKVNALDLQPGDRVLFACGDTWRAEMLVITSSGAAGSPITFGSYPEGCANKPILSGAQPVAGWSLYGGNVYVADLAAGQNAGKFGHGVNQLFRDGQRLTLGRWPNLDAGDGGYSTIDGQPAGDQITDNELPAGDWSGAVAHIRGMRWYILNRQVIGRAGQTLALGADAGCWGTCTGWGYFLNNHLATLDREGEWHYDAATQRVYLYTSGGPPADGQVEGSVVLEDDDRSWGGVVLGQDLGSPISHVAVKNLEIRHWFRHGIATPTNHAHYENHHLTLQDNTIVDVDSIGINLASWVYSAQDGRPDGWRGGYELAIRGNTVEGANRMGINTYARQSAFVQNTIRDVGLVENLGAAGLGCSFTAGEGACTEDGDGIRIKSHYAGDSGNSNSVAENYLERIAYNGMDIFGHHNTIEHNLIRQACYTKGDCGGVRTYGSDNLADTRVHDLVFRENIIVDTIGNTDGCHTTYKDLFGFGLYIDHYSRDVEIRGNTILSSTVSGILYQNSTGTIHDNVLYNNSSGSMYAAQVTLTDPPTSITEQSGNVLYSLKENAWTLYLQEMGVLLASDANYFFHPYVAEQISVGGWSGRRTFEAWQATSGLDGGSKQNWFTLGEGDPPLSRVFYNTTASPVTVELGDRRYLDLDQNDVLGSIGLPPFGSVVLVDNGPASLTLASMAPNVAGVDQAADFTLTVYGAGFTEDSVVRWGGADRPTTFGSSSRLSAEIAAADVSAVAEIPVTVYDPAPAPGGTETPPLTFHVVESVSRVYVPAAFRR